MSDKIKSNLEAVQRWIDASNSHDIERILETLHEGYEYDFGNAKIKGKQEASKAWKLYLEGIPDLHFEPLTLVANDEYVAARFRVTGTNKGPFRFAGTGSLDNPIPAANKPIEYEEGAFFRIQDGKVMNLWSYWDTALFRSQL